MNKITAFILDKCAKSCNLPEGVADMKIGITASRFKIYHGATSEEISQVHRELEKITSRVPSFEVEYQTRGFNDPYILKAIHVNDGHAFLENQCIDPMGDHLKTSVLFIEGLLKKAPEWVQEVLADLPNTWKANKIYKGFSPKNHAGLALGLSLAVWLEQQDLSSSVDFRTASTKALGGSKLLESNLRIIAKLFRLKENRKDDMRDDKAVLADFSVTKFAPLIRICGDVRVVTKYTEIPVIDFMPYVAVPASGIESFKISPVSSYILTIENLTTFERYCREVSDGGVVIYAGGFPSRHWVRHIRSLIKSAAPRMIPFYHWGDIDVGGYRILAYLAKGLNYNVRPFQMLGKNDLAHGEMIELKSLLEALVGCDFPAVNELRLELEESVKNDVEQYWVEQESLDIQSPVSSTR